jgi:hypothetical protein
MSAGSDKNLRLLGQETSPWYQPTLQETITALQVELAKGAAVYTPAELCLLARKLVEEEERFRVITAGG